MTPLLHGIQARVAGTLLPPLRRYFPKLVRAAGLPIRVYSSIDEWKPRQGEALEVIHAPARTSVVPVQARHLPGKSHAAFRDEITFVDLRTFVATLRDAVVLGRNGYVMDAKQCVLGDVPKVYKANYNPADHPLLRLARAPQTELLGGTSAVLSIFSVNNYYHWMFEALPRLELLRQAGHHLEDVDWFIVNDLDNQFVQASLQRLGIPAAKLRISRDGHAFRCSTLLVPSMPCQTNPSRWVCNFLRQSFPDGQGKPGAERLFVSRLPGARRSLVNEAEVETLLVARGFRKVYLESCSLGEQISLFAQAGAIVAAHGASMANLVFCRAGTKVIELFHPDYVNPCYRAVAHQAGVDYGYLTGAGTYGGVVQDMKHCGDDILVSMPELTELLDAFELFAHVGDAAAQQVSNRS